MTNVSMTQWSNAQRHEQDFWESYASTYERYPQILLNHLSILRDAGEYVRDELTDPVIKEALEVGVGPLGIGVLGMQEPNFRITAVDPLPQIDLDLSGEVLAAYVQELRKSVTYRRSQGESLPFDDDFYDFACCHNVIDHARAPQIILEEIFRVLKPRGYLYLTLNTFSFFGRLKFEGLRRLHPGKLIFACHPHTFLHSDILKTLSLIGFEIVRHGGEHGKFLGRGRLSKYVCRKSD